MRMMIYVTLITAMMCSVNAFWNDASFTDTAEAHVYDEGNTSVTITDDTLKNLNYAHDLYSVMSMLGIELPTEKDPFIHVLEDNRTSVLRSFKNTYQFMENPEQATCNPEMTAVDLELTPEKGLIYYPTCVRVNRCGGCCPNKDLLACQPVASNKVIVKVVEMNSKNSVQNEHVPRRTRGRPVKLDVKTFNVTVEEHTACACLCILKERDCNLDKHTYDEAGCTCTCKHKDDEEKCKGKNSHFWDHKTCQCLCRNKISCSTGQEFKHDTCACEAIQHGISWDDLFLRSSAISMRQRRKPVEVPLDF